MLKAALPLPVVEVQPVRLFSKPPLNNIDVGAAANALPVAVNDGSTAWSVPALDLK